MTTPTLTVNGATYTMPKPKAGMWRKVMGFSKSQKSILDEDFVEKRCGFLAEVFGDGELTAEYLIENMPLEDVVKTYSEMVTFLFAMVTGKLDEVEKNVGEGDETIQ